MSSKPTKRSRTRPINEALLHYTWRTKSIYQNKLVSTEGHPIEVLSWGQLNHHEGPDFSDVRIRYRGMQWAGHAEMHVMSSDWHAHKHSNDPNYRNVVLHVVYEDNLPLVDVHGKKVITLELKDCIPESVIRNATFLLTNQDKLSCHQHITSISAFWINDWKEKQIIARLEEKVNRIKARIKALNGDWEQLTYEMLARSLGHGNNADQMEKLSKTCPWKLLRKEIHRRNNLEALLFGMSGLLFSREKDSYIQELQSDFQFLCNKYQLEMPGKIHWRFMRSRPSNFPTLRISQLSGILHNRFSLVRSIVESESLDALKDLFKSSASAYWRKHYLFGKLTDDHSVQVGASAIQIIIINTCIPLIFAYGSSVCRVELQKKALYFLYNLPAERNSILAKWKQAGIHAGSAADSQALLYTYNNYCSSKRCLDCRLGHRIISTKKDHEL